MPGTRNRRLGKQASPNARRRREAHRANEAVSHRKPSPERQARLHPSRFEQRTLEGTTAFTYDADLAFTPTKIIGDALADHIKGVACDVREQEHPLPWRAPDVKHPGKGWQVLDADDRVAEYAKSRDKARTRAREMNG